MPTKSTAVKKKSGNSVAKKSKTGRATLIKRPKTTKAIKTRISAKSQAQKGIEKMQNVASGVTGPF